MIDERALDETYQPDELIKRYGLSPQEARRVISEFGSNKREIDRLLGHRSMKALTHPGENDVRLPDFLYDI